jgi:hypothetical protein
MCRWWLSLVVVVGGCTARPERTVESLLTDVEGEFDLLAPSLLSAAGERLASKWGPLGREFEGKPTILCTPRGREYETYRSPDNKERKDFYTTKFGLQAVETVHHFRIMGIESIQRTGRRDYPFTGTVSCEVEIQIRESQKLLHELRPVIPDGWNPTGAMGEDGEVVP